MALACHSDQHEVLESEFGGVLPKSEWCMGFGFVFCGSSILRGDFSVSISVLHS